MSFQSGIRVVCLWGFIVAKPSILNDYGAPLGYTSTLMKCLGGNTKKGEEDMAQVYLKHRYDTLMGLETNRLNITRVDQCMPV